MTAKAFNYSLERAKLDCKNKTIKTVTIWTLSAAILLLVISEQKKHVFDPALSTFCENNDITCDQYIVYGRYDQGGAIHRNQSLSVELTHYFSHSSFEWGVLAATCSSALILLVGALLSCMTSRADGRKNYGSAAESTPIIVHAHEAPTRCAKIKRTMPQYIQVSCIVFVTAIALSAFRAKLLKESICGTFLLPQEAQAYQVDPTCNHFPSSISSDAINQLKTLSSSLSNELIETGATRGLLWVAASAVTLFCISCSKIAYDHADVPLADGSDTTMNKVYAPSYGAL
jgi:hypothetical protein